MKQKKFLIYLADLTHDYLDMLQYTPIGIGFLASYAYSVFGDEIEIKLFKSADKLLDAAEDRKPDLLGLSNYTWNKELSFFAAKKIKKLYPEIPIIMGGPNIGTEPPDIEDFLRASEVIDIYCIFAAEKSVAAIIKALVNLSEAERTGKALRSINIDGGYSLLNGSLVGNACLDNEKDLDFIPSPYTTHLLDEFLNQGMTPLLETNRGCPYSCTFCAWGVSALNKLRVFGLDRVTEDLDYVARFGLEYPEFIFADANFGILKRDVKIAKHIRKLHEETQTFSAVTIFWSKSAQPHMIDIGRALGHLTTTYVAFQSLDEKVLGAMKRKNINTDKLLKLINSLKQYTHTPQTDILVGSPAETFDSHLQSLDTALEFGIQKINGGEICMLPGTEMSTVDSRKSFGIKTKYRLFEGGSGLYRGELVYELQEVIRATSTMTEKEMIQLRILRAMFFGSVTLGENWPLIAFLSHNRVRCTQVLKALLKRKNNNATLAKSLDWLEKMAKEEFFETPSDIAAHLSNDENRKAMFSDSAFVKLNFGFTARLNLYPEEYDAYYVELEKVLIDETGHLTTPVVISELLKLCRARNYLTQCLRGNFDREIKVLLSRPTIDALLQCGYLLPHQAPDEDGGLHISMDHVTSNQIKKALEDYGDTLNTFTMSQILQAFIARCHLEPSNKISGAGKNDKVAFSNANELASDQHLADRT